MYLYSVLVLKVNRIDNHEQCVTVNRCIKSISMRLRHELMIMFNYYFKWIGGRCVCGVHMMDKIIVPNK